MATRYELLVCFVLVTLSSTVFASTSSYPDENRLSAEDENDAREDYPDLDDLSSFFDFDLVPSKEAGSNRKRPVRLRPNLSKHYYYYKATDSFYRGDSPPQDKGKQVVTLGSHYKPESEPETTSSEQSANDSKEAVNRFVMGNYQVSVVDANSPVLSKLGLNKEDLDKLSVLTKRSANTNIMGSDSVHSPTYAENPRTDYNHPTYSHPPPSYDTSRYTHHSPPERHHRQGEYYPEDKPSYSHGHNPPSYSYQPSSHSSPPPQGSYDPKSYKVVRNPPHRGPSGYNHPPPRYDSYPPPTSHTPKRGSSESWKPRVTTHTDWDDKDRRQEYQESDSYPPHPLPLPHREPTSNSVPYSKPAYSSDSSSDKHGYHHPSSYSKPKTTYGPSSSSSGDYHAYKPSYQSSPNYSTSKSTPSRAGSAEYPSSSYHSHHEPSKPAGITIKFKGKAPGGHSGLNIPLSFSPFDVAKKLLPQLNPLNNKKITIGITIENKEKQHHGYHAY
ncbi:uncharacterized protein [Parasteatoda tepidariorum]|uniref:uncharacterized protein n=1 Tax=Parasteatoda tepidariorum TaxID=114398 RepID=UPI00077FAC16|nr:mRNA-binding protein PUF3-like [Parasteatoda tepidariorum]